MISFEKLQELADEGCSYKEIAEKTGLKLGQIKWQMEKFGIRTLRGRKRSRVERPCGTCGKRISRKGFLARKHNIFFCNNTCRNIHNNQKRKNSVYNKTIAEIKEDCESRNVSLKYFESRIRSYGRSWLKDLYQNPCENCGYDKFVDLCHIKAISDFSEDTPLSEIHSPTNVLVLCPNCHREFDNNLISMRDIRP